MAVRLRAGRGVQRRLPPAPGLFSTTMFQPVSSAMALPIMRVSVSVPPPGGNGEMMVMGPLPRSAAEAAAQAPRSAAPISVLMRFIVFLVCF